MTYSVSMQRTALKKYFFFMLTFFVVSMLYQTARADTPISKCYVTSQVCIGPAIAVSIFDYNLVSRSISAGTVATGYAVTYADGLVGAGLYLDTQFGQNVINRIEPAFLLSFVNDIYVGTKLHVTDQGNWWSIIGALGMQL